jgi:hypothetical protein
MQFHRIFGIVEKAQRADKAAVGTINRPLQGVGVWGYENTNYAH